MPTNGIIENCVIYLCTTAGVLGLYAMSGSMHSLWMLLLLLFVNYRVRGARQAADLGVSRPPPPLNNPPRA
jgi:uncharacterized protein (DUF58 family)